MFVWQHIRLCCQQYTFLQEQFYKNTRFIFAQNLKTKLITTQPRQKIIKSQIFSYSRVNKIAANAAQLAKCILLHAYSRTGPHPARGRRRPPWKI